ncbi:MAG: nucleoside-diphosphate kinase [bacterium]|nr:nucleoside-diphosphate kinase [bacterium]
MHPKEERTLVIIKPDGVQRSLIGEIVRRYERSGLKLIALKMFVPTPEQVMAHYLTDPDWKQKVGEKAIEAYKQKGQKVPSRSPQEIGEIVLNNLRKYLTSGPAVAMVWQGMHAVGVVRKITGGTEPLTSDVGTIRGDLTLDSYLVADTDGRAVRNLIHASGNAKEAEQEIPIWFVEEEILKYRLVGESILYDVNLDGILE